MAFGSNSLRIWPFSPLPASWAPLLEQEIREETGLQCHFIDEKLDLEFAYDPGRKQYHSSRILLALVNHFKASQDKIIGITELDLFIPILTYVFGEAQLDGIASVVSWYRLRPEFYGLPPDANLVRQRLSKEIMHELGHNFALRHCLDFQCVMHASTYAEEIDLKTRSFCAACKAQAQKGLGI
jgi:archaemetzincin